MCEEPQRGIRFNIVDVSMMADSIHRGGGQIIPAARRVFYASTLTAEPRLQEPVYLCEIVTPLKCVGQIYNCVSMRRGEVIGEQEVSGTPLINVKAYLPVAESFSFNQFIREATSGQAFP